MAQERPEYEVNDEFNTMATSIVSKYPEKFHGLGVDKICCVNINNKSNPKKSEGQTVSDLKERCWKTIAVKMPMSLHCPYDYYVVLYLSDWEELSEKHKLALVSDVLHSFGEEGKLNPCDTKGYHAVFSTLGLDYLSDPNIPHLLKDQVEWKC